MAVIRELGVAPPLCWPTDGFQWPLVVMQEKKFILNLKTPKTFSHRAPVIVKVVQLPQLAFKNTFFLSMTSQPRAHRVPDG